VTAAKPCSAMRRVAADFRAWRVAAFYLCVGLEA
jgi:hypothetical protein